MLLLPGYFRGEFFTAYALIEKRFGARTRAVAATTFLVTRAIAEGVRVAAIALVVSVVLGTSERLAVMVVIALTICLHARRRNEGRDLDGRGAISCCICWGAR